MPVPQYWHRGFPSISTGKHLLNLILGSRAKLCGNEDFGVSIVYPKNHSVLNLDTQCSLFYPSSWSIPKVSAHPRLFELCRM